MLYTNEYRAFVRRNLQAKDRNGLRPLPDGGKSRVTVLDANGKPVKPACKRPYHTTPHEKGTAADMYFDGLSYRRTAENIGQYFGRDTTQVTVYCWFGNWRIKRRKSCAR